jgi:bifunctional ADP-heptose synthase (sugar kinase/adenylyltransferase)
MARFRSLPIPYDALVLSDYCKGALDDQNFASQVIEAFRKSCPGMPIFLDSRSVNLDRFAGADVFKPNSEEWSLYEITMKKQPGFRTIVRTRGHEGMDYVSHEELVCGVRGTDVGVADPTGAGDTAMAGLVYAMISHAHSPEDTLRFANALAGISCKHSGTYVVNRDDLRQAIQATSR